MSLHAIPHASCKGSSVISIKPNTTRNRTAAILLLHNYTQVQVHYHTQFIDVKVEGASDVPASCKDILLLPSFVKICRLVERLKRTTHRHAHGQRDELRRPYISLWKVWEKNYVPTSQKPHCFHITKTNKLTTFREIIAV